MKRVVADTNVLVSALQFGGKPIITETLRVLRDKFERAPEWLAEADRQMRVITRLVQPTEAIQAIEADPTDDRILECAVAAEADVIVSGDSHLLSLGGFRGISIQRSPSFLAASRIRAGANPGDEGDHPLDGRSDGRTAQKRITPPGPLGESGGEELQNHCTRASRLVTLVG